MGTAARMLAEMTALIGTRGRPNEVTDWYAARHGREYRLAPWCDMTITLAAHNSGNVAAVLPGGDRAYTVDHARDFQKAGRWIPGTTANVNAARPGDIVFFDWGFTDSIERIDHVGVVVRPVGGGSVLTIEGNTSDSCAQRTRNASVIAGFGRPAYATPPPAPTFTEALVKQLPTLKPGDGGEHVQTLQALLIARGHKITVDGDFGPATEAAVKALQKAAKLTVDGVVSVKTWPVLLGVM